MPAPLIPETPTLSPVVEGYYVNSPLCLNLGHALAVRRAHPPSYTSFTRLAVATHCSSPSSPLAKKVIGMERRQLSWQRGAQLPHGGVGPWAPVDAFRFNLPLLFPTLGSDVSQSCDPRLEHRSDPRLSR